MSCSGKSPAGECSELFACGTAAIVSPIGAGRQDGREYAPMRIDAVAKELREALLAIQERRAPDPFGWTRESRDSPLPYKARQYPVPT